MPNGKNNKSDPSIKINVKSTVGRQTNFAHKVLQNEIVNDMDVTEINNSLEAIKLVNSRHTVTPSDHVL